MMNTHVSPQVSGDRDKICGLRSGDDVGVVAASSLEVGLEGETRIFVPFGSLILIIRSSLGVYAEAA